MWWGSGEEPGGSGGEGPSKEPQTQQLQDLQEQFESQQTLIAQLKEMLKKTEHSSSVSREKVEEYANTLTKMNARAKRGKLRKTEGAKTDEDLSIKSDTTKELSTKKLPQVSIPGKEKVELLRQQLEENRLKLAQRDKNQKGIEEMVNQLKAQLDSSQISIDQSTVTIPKYDSKTSSYKDLSKDELIICLQDKDKHIEEQNSKIQQLQANVLDLQENVKEKDSVIDARTKAITLLSENLSKKGKNTLDMLDETKEQMRNMQEHFVNLEAKMKDENDKLLLELEESRKEMEILLQNNTELNQNKESLQEKLENAIMELNNCKLELSTSELKVQDLIKSNQELETILNDLRNTESSRSASNSPQRSKKSKSWKKTKPKSESSENLTKISELELQIQEYKSEIEKLKSIPKKTDEDNSEVKNLKAQLDTMNKNLIKTKAQYKAKLKELQKKTTPGDVNEKVLGLESENVKLEQRIVELEEEKGNLQLKLVDVDVNKDKEHIADLENKIEEQKMAIENHIRIITILETQITDKSNEISSLRNELSNLTHIENAQVCSEITSVQLEEQLEKQAILKKELEDNFEEMKKEKENLLEKIEELNKEKQEVNTKLVSYMQENMELIDRLEKLSAEKVSSAESIEIVESLTQQEKLEIEAYQQNLEFTSDKEHIEPTDIDQNTDLNESVSKLTEDSSELLERIELFTVERREVMEKMESLLSEKEHLLEKLNKLENEKLEFVKKYDSLCTEKDQLIQQIQSDDKFDVIDGIRMDSASNSSLIDEYKILIDNQKVEIVQLKQELLKMTQENSEIPLKNDNLNRLSVEKEGLELLVNSLNVQFFDLHKEYAAFLEENKKLKDQLKKHSENIFEKDTGEKDLKELQKILVECEIKISSDAEEIKYLQEVLEDNKNELIKSADYISNLTNDLSSKHSELSTYKSEIDQLHSLIQQQNNEIELKKIDCQHHIETIDLLSSQLQELKAVMNENFKELQKYEDLNNQISEADQLIEIKDTEIDSLRKEKQIYESRIVSLENELKHKDDHFKEACQQLKDKCASLETKIQANTGSLDDIKVPFESKIQELENECKKLELKHKEHVEKMKKIAANLKKKAVTCKELETKLAEVNEKWETEKVEKDKIIEQQQILIGENNNQIELISNKLQEKEVALSNLQIEFEHNNSKFEQLNLDFNNQLQLFENEKMKLQNEIALNNNLEGEITNYEKEIQRLNEQLETLQSQFKNEDTQSKIEELQNLRNALEAKIQEKDMYIENLESENVTIKDRISKLSEGLSQIEERRRSLELYTLELGAELEAKSITCEEISQSENILENRLEYLVKHDKSIENKLKDMTQTNQKLNESVENLTANNIALQTKLSELEFHLKEKEKECERMLHLENDSIQLQGVVANLEHDIKKLHTDYEKKLFEKTSVIETMEQEFNLQFNELDNERKVALNRCEHLQEKVQEYSENELILQQDLDTLKEKLENVRLDLEKQLNENANLNEINSNNLMIIEQLKNQFVPQDIDQNLQSELLRLQNILTEKDSIIQNYQQQNMQLQMSINSTTSPFDISNNDNTALLKQIHDLTNELQVNQQKLSELENINITLTQQNDEYNKYILTLQNELSQQKELLLLKTAEHSTDEILNTAQKIVHEQQPIETPIQKIAIKEVTFEPQSENNDELLKKIKTLEFMLYNMEKDKDDAIRQCHSLSNELTRLVYEREGLIGHKKEKDSKPIDIMNVESEIVTEADLEDSERTKRELKHLEYSQTDSVPSTSGNIPVEEPLIQPRSAYLCFDDDKQPEKSGWGVEDDILSSSIEGLIVQDKDIKITPEEHKKLQEIEFGKVHIPIKGSKSIEEKPCDPKQAYLCYPDDGSVDIQDAFASEEDGWGWNAEELKLELKHQQTLMSVPPKTQDDSLLEKIKQLEEEKTKLTEDLKAQQQKSTKLIKKLKEIKAKNDSLSAQLQKSAGDLDDMIQDELHSQIKSLESKLKEEQAKDKAEKENLLKRIDTLTAANERMIEIKEKQDNEVELLQFNNRQLTTQFEQLKKEDQTKPEIQPAFSKDFEIQDASEYENLTKKIEELNGIIKDLTIDNEEMQLLLEEQRKLRLEAEKALSSLPIQENMKSEQEYLQILQEKDELSNQLIKFTNENQILSDKLKATRSEDEYLTLLEEKESLNNKIIEIKNENKILLEKLEEFKVVELKYDEVNNKLIEALNDNRILNEKLAQFCEISDNDLCPRLQLLQDKLILLTQQKDGVIHQQNVELQKFSQENDNLKVQLNNIVVQVENSAEQSKEILKTEVNKLQEDITLVENRNKEFESLLGEKQNVIADLNSTIEKLNVDKRNLEIKLKEISGVLSSENADQLEGLSERLEIIVKEVQEKNKEVSELNKILNIERLEFEQKLSSTLEQLALEWAERVEQRGTDVAESWKLHVESRETEFAQIEQTLRLELTDIYNKNDTLLMENGELQKKVGLLLQEKQASESDNKTEALQKIVEERQSEILTLSQQLQDVSIQLEVKNNEIVSLQQIIDSIQKQNYELIEKNKELHSNFKNHEQANKQLESENRELKKFSKQNEELNAQLKIENQEIEILTQTVDGLKQELSKLRDEIQKEKFKNSDNDNKVIELQQDLINLELKITDIIKLIDSNDLEVFDSSYDKILYLEEKVMHLIQSMHDLRVVKDQIATEKAMMEETYMQLNSTFSANNQNNEMLTSELSDLRETIRKLQIDLNESTEARNFDLIQMNGQMKEMESKYEKEIEVKNVELQKLQEEIQEFGRSADEKLRLQQELEVKMLEINEMRKEIENLHQEISKNKVELINLQQELQIKIAEINNLHLEIESLQNQTKNLSKLESEKQNLQLQLESKLSEIHELNQQIKELNLSHEESIQMKQTLEQQTQEISTLKQELEKKTEDFNQIYEELETMVIQQQQQLKSPEKRVHFKEPISETSQNEPKTDSENADRAELDLALYMLHQRDVRCEELTVELMQLLEERDTLQLRLSNAIRINEDLRSKVSPQLGKASMEELNTPKVVQSTGAIPKSKSSDIVLKATGTELAMEALESEALEKSRVGEKQELDSKLSQLRSVGYNRDKTLKDDQEIRYLQQMSLMQQHRDLASRLPPEAAAKLVDASYTLSRDVQSPSKVLLNWLWGKSTPKVNDI